MFVCFDILFILFVFFVGIFCLLCFGAGVFPLVLFVLLVGFIALLYFVCFVKCNNWFSHFWSSTVLSCLIFQLIFHLHVYFHCCPTVTHFNQVCQLDIPLKTTSAQFYRMYAYTPFCLPKSKQNTSHDLYMCHDTLAGILILVSIISLCLATF